MKIKDISWLIDSNEVHEITPLSAAFSRHSMVKLRLWLCRSKVKLWLVTQKLSQKWTFKWLTTKFEKILIVQFLEQFLIQHIISRTKPSLGCLAKWETDGRSFNAVQSLLLKNLQLSWESTRRIMTNRQWDKLSVSWKSKVDRRYSWGTQ